MARPTQVLLGILLLVLLVSGLGACRGTPDESRIRQAIAETANAASDADGRGAVAHLSDDFEGNSGELMPKDLANLLRLAKLRGETLHVVMGPVEVEPRGDRYVARFTVTLGSGGKLLPSSIGVYRVETAWRKDGKAWVCFAATWERQV